MPAYNILTTTNWPVNRPQIRCMCDICSIPLDPKSKCWVNDPRHRRYICKTCYRRSYSYCLQCQVWYKTLEYGCENTRFCRGCWENKKAEKTQCGPRNPHSVNWRRSETPLRGGHEIIKSLRCFGVELETSQCHYAERLQGRTGFGAKYDATCSGREFDSPILGGDRGLEEILNFCDMANRRGWKVDSDCGTHLHLDMRYETRESFRRIGYAYLVTFPLWRSLVDPHRARNEYGEAPSITPDRFLNVDLYEYCADVTRYQFINFAAFDKFQTLEIRGLQGTLDKTLLTNWIQAHLTFADWASDTPVDEIKRVCDWKHLKKCIGPAARYFGRVSAGRC